MANIDVLIVDSIESTKRNASLPTEVPIGKLTAALARKMGLPPNAPGGRPMIYRLNLVKAGMSTPLDEDVNLQQAGVQNGDTLRINAEMQAGK